MKERPILFSGPMVRAILDGRKTQTRRIMKPQPTIDRRGIVSHHSLGGSFAEHVFGSCFVSLTPKPYAAVGDTLWVRETWRYAGHGAGPEVHYPADLDEYTRAEKGPWKPSIHMPRSASRLTLDVTAVRVERLQAISEADAIAEGVRELPLQEGAPGAWWTADPSTGAALHARDPVAAFRKLWDSINADRASWESNPWVWVVEFARAEVRK